MKTLERNHRAKKPANGSAPGQNRPGAVATGNPIPAAWWGNRPAQPAPPVPRMSPMTGASLIQRARKLDRTLSPGLATFEAQYARFHPVLRSALARETVRLARAARVRECAAFLALVSQFEN